VPQRLQRAAEEELPELFVRDQFVDEDFEAAAQFEPPAVSLAMN
jgi:hypothetical protein